MRKLFLAIAGIFAAIPGLAIIQSGIGVPPGYKLLFGGVIEACGAFSLLVLWVNQKKLKRFSPIRISRYSIRMGLLFLAFLILYILLYKFCVIEHPRGTAYYPLWTNGEISTMIARAGSRRAAIEEYGIAAVILAIDKMPSMAINITTVVLLLIYQSVFTSLTMAFGLLGLYKGAPIVSRSA
jgi:hypothetical protein